MLTNAPDSEIVKAIIEDALNKKIKEKQDPCISKLYVIQMIKSQFHPTHIFNKIANYPDSRHDGPTKSGVVNIDRGAQKLYRNCVYALKSLYDFDKNGFIRRRVVDEKTPEYAEQFIKKSASRESQLMAMIGDEWIEEDSLLPAFSETIDEEKAIVTYNGRIKSLNKQSIKNGGSESKVELDRATKIERGRTMLFRKVIWNLEKINLVQRENGKMRKL